MDVLFDPLSTDFHKDVLFEVLDFQSIYLHIHVLHNLYPPTPAANRGSALEEDLLATRGQKRKADRQEEEKKREAARSGQARRREEARSS